jgi:putative PIN family toxin of toxin-antitoxin system
VRIVIDTSVIVAGLRSRKGNSYALLRAVGERRFVVLLSPAMMLEYEEVLKRDEHSQEAGLSLNDIDLFLEEFSALAEPVQIHFQWRPQLRDSDDEMVLETAINGRADAIITFNKADFAASKQSFGIQILTPGELLRRIQI